MVFLEVKKTDKDMIESIYRILKTSGQNMREKYDLMHWGNPLPIEKIVENCESKRVFIAKDEETGCFAHTFYLDTIETENMKLVKICKFSTAPEFEKRGIASASIKFIEEYCRKIGISLLTLEVYDKSQHAINFYLNRGFRVTGCTKTTHFAVLSMQKEIEIDA